MADFPTLSQLPDAEQFSENTTVDPTLRDEFENGSVTTRSKFTASLRQWGILYRFLSNADKQTLVAFQRTVSYGAGSFNWTNPIDSEVYVVRFGEPIDFKIEPENGGLWRVSFFLVEINAIPSSSAF